VAKRKEGVIVQCPACESEISPDGKQLHKRSERLIELVKLEKTVPELEKELERLEKEIKEKKNDAVQLESKAKTQGDGEPRKSWFRRGSR
jgi:predicted RNase H-like nuclease (RuvC/YqgF family)